MPKKFGHDPLPWKPLPLMEDYLDNLAAEEVSNHHLRATKKGLARFAIFCEQEGITHPADIERTHIVKYQGYLSKVESQKGTVLALQYRQQLMKYLRAWINWLVDTEVLLVTPWVRIRVGRVTKKPKPLSDEEIQQLFDTHRQAAFAMPPFYYHRREVILTLLYGWGLRLHELRALTVSSVDMNRDFVVAINKGGGEKVLPYADEMKTIVQRWMSHRSKYANPHGTDSLLIDRNGSPLSAQSIYKIITELGAAAGVAINPHRLRDSFGTALIDNDVPVERIMKMMGHTQRAQTLAYAKLHDRKIKESHDEVMNPILSRLLGGKLP